MLAKESVGDAEAVGDGRVVIPVVLLDDGNDQMLEVAVEVSKLGDSPIPSSLSKLEFQMETRSPRRPPDEELLELMDPDELKAPELVDEVREVDGKTLSASEAILFVPLGSK